MGVIYRRARTFGFKRWHNTQRCRNWPRSNYEEQRYAPAAHEMCRECQRLVGENRFRPTARSGWF